MIATGNKGPSSDALLRLRHLPRSRSTVARWAAAILEHSQSDSDLKTMSAWATHIGSNTTSLSEMCRLLRIRPRDARDLGRALSAALSAVDLHCEPADLLDIADGRTLRKFLVRAGDGFRPLNDGTAMVAFLEKQSFVDPTHHAVRTLHAALLAHWAESVGCSACS